LFPANSSYAFAAHIISETRLAQLNQFDEIIAKSGALAEGEQGYQAYYKDELGYIQGHAEEPTAWLTKCMGVVLQTKEIEQYHRMDVKQVWNSVQRASVILCAPSD
jgi:hypothetical protein